MWQTEGKSIILITHKLKEIMQVCDRCTVIRRGRGVGTVDVADTSENKLAEMMVGREVSFAVEKETAVPKETVLSIKDLQVEDTRKVDVVNGLNLDVRAGEIVGVAGVDGNGQTELVEAMTGLRLVKAGSVTVSEQDITHYKPRKVTEAGVGHIPEDRHKHGMVMAFTVAENMLLQTYYQFPYTKKGILNYPNIYEKAKALIQEYDVRTPNEKTPARSLSGGNQQKMIIAREVNRSPDMLIAAQPTRGLDVGAIEFIHGKLVEERDKGHAVLLVSLELDEILNLSDRIAVIYEGTIVDIVKADETDEKELGLLMAGGKREAGEGQR
ncbi:ABC transporter [Natribacillus halophilus]|uniref:ABC transporter n=1 Tax=Natribacillus halophilus TaxID=549003 RepID=A0A1G8PUA4_9BACI|nr:ABC transporter [Natribacillus halophilus]